MDSIIEKILSSYKATTIIYFLIVLFNILLLNSYFNLIVSLFQYLLVLWCISKNKIYEAIFLHFSFIFTSIQPTTLLSLQEEMSLPLLNYARLKIGPICFHYFVSAFLLLLPRNRAIKFSNNSLFPQLFRILKILFLVGVLLGLVGFLFLGNYDIDAVTRYSTYMFVVILNMMLLVKFNSPALIKLFHKTMIPIMGGAILASGVSYFFLGIKSAYGSLDIVLQPELCYFGVIFLLSFYESQYKIYTIFVGLLYLILNLLGSTGHNIIIIFVGLIYFVYFTYFSSETKLKYPIIVKRSRKFFLLLIPLAIILVLKFVSFGDIFLIKFGNVLSIFTMNVDEIDISPYIRVATTMNIWDNNKYNPIGLLFGQGYGGYFTDSLHLFDGLGDLSDGGWPEKDVQTGRFTRGHDTFASVPLIHGFGGLFILLYICFKYAKFARKSYMAYAIFPWIVFTFYFNIQYAIIGISFLYAAEILNYKEKKINDSSKRYDEKSMLFYEQGLK